MINESHSQNHHQIQQETLTKHIDSKGRFYYVFPKTGEISYDKPHGIFVPLKTIKKCDSASEENEEMIRLKSDRKRIIDTLRKDYEAHRIRCRKEDHKSRDEAVENMWIDACNYGKLDGVVVMNWKNLGGVSSCLHAFDRDYGKPLISLSLNGNGMNSISTLLGCESALERLCLKSNHFESLDNCIGKFQSLTYLDLSQNKIEHLPDTFGQLKSLKILDLSNNMLSYLPSSIVDLTDLNVFYLNYNSIKELPNAMNHMRLEEIQIISNQLSFLPTCTFPHLKIFLANDNKVRCIPTELCASSKLDTLLLSKNKLKEIPYALCDLASLKKLWLDNNQIATLPHGFHKLIHLQDLRLEGNRDMIRPPLYLITEGVPKILRWCKLHLARNDYERKKRIVIYIQDILAEVSKLKLCGVNEIDEPHEAVFESEVAFGDGKFIFVLT